VIFLLLSAAHFGWDDPMWVASGSGRWAGLERYAVGSIPILLPIIAHPGEVTVVFSWLMPSRVLLNPEAVAASGWMAAGVLLPVLALRALRLSQGGAMARASAAELVAIAVLHVVCSPLIAFLTYFCGWHSMRHALELADHLAPGRPADGLKQFARAALPLTAVSVIAAIAVAPLIGSVAAQPSEVLATLIFVGLSVLTVPHMGMMAMERRAAHRRRAMAGRTASPLALPE
jgi:Brp/Blh family beta-carotene 15,15'-monooxygenase